MGRGQADKAATAKGLLYGRRSRSPEAQKRAGQARKQTEKEIKKIALARSYQQAGAALADGCAKPLQELLDNPAGHGLKTVEYEQMRKLAPLLFELARDCDDLNSATKPLTGSDDLGTLLEFQVRLSYTRANSEERAQVDHAISLYALDLAHRQIIDQLSDDRYEIGSLPKVTFGKDFSEHLLADGEILCGQARYHGNLGPAGSAVCSVLETNVDCQACLKKYENNPDAVETMTPTTWLAHLREGDLDNWATIALRRLDHLPGDSDQERAENLIESYRQESVDNIDSYLTPFSEYYIE